MFILEFSKLLINYSLIIDNDYFRNNQIVLSMSDVKFKRISYDTSRT